jgi:SAM-dependent methyltransferase
VTVTGSPPTPPTPRAFACRACGRESPPLVLDLGEVPASDQFPPADDPYPDPRWPLTLHMCPSCLLVQLGPGRAAYPEPQLAVDSATALEHARTSVAEVLAAEGISPGSTVIELDSSHGASWLPRFLEAGLREVRPDGVADLVVDVHHLMHFEHLDPVLAAHAARVAPGGRFVCEFFHVLPVVQKTLIDTIRHGHFVYLSVLAAGPLLARHGLTVTRAELVDVYGGSVRLTAARADESPAVDAGVEDVLALERAAGLDRLETLEALGARGAGAAREFRRHLELLSRQGRRVAGYGAPSKAPVLLALSKVGVDLLPYTVDLSPAKHGCRVPGVGVPIRPVQALVDDRPDDVIVLTWDIVDEVAAQLARMSAGSGWEPRLWAPLPEPRELSLR